MVNPLSLSSAVRALGAAGAVAHPSGLRSRRLVQAGLLGTTDALAHWIDPKGITVLSITPDEGETFSAAKQLTFDALSSVGWAGLGLFTVLGAERLPISRTARALSLGGAVYFIDRASAQLNDKLLAMAEAKAAEGAAQSS